jgi:hypothetical protein
MLKEGCQMCNMIVDAMKKCTSSNIFEKLLIMAIGLITTQKTQKVGPATKHKSGVQIGARKGERYKLLRDNTTFISARYIQGRFARFLHLAGCDVAQDWSLLVSGT